MRIRDGKNSDPRSGTNIPDPQHWLQTPHYQWPRRRGRREKNPFPYPGSEGQKGIGSRIRIRNTGQCWQKKYKPQTPRCQWPRRRGRRDRGRALRVGAVRCRAAQCPARGRRRRAWRRLRGHQSCGSAFISSGSGSSILGWIPIRIQGFND